MLGLGSGFNPSEVTQAKFGFKFDSPKLRGRINLNKFERSELGRQAFALNLPCENLALPSLEPSLLAFISQTAFTLNLA